MYRVLEVTVRRRSLASAGVVLPYGGMDEPEIKIIDVFICKLRKKLANASRGKDYIETVWGRGYVLRELTEGQARISGR